MRKVLVFMLFATISAVAWPHSAAKADKPTDPKVVQPAVPAVVPAQPVTDPTDAERLSRQLIKLQMSQLQLQNAKEQADQFVLPHALAKEAEAKKFDAEVERARRKYNAVGCQLLFSPEAEADKPALVWDCPPAKKDKPDKPEDPKQDANANKGPAPPPAK